MRRLVHWLLLPLRFVGFLCALVFCAIAVGADAAEDWYTDGKGLGRLVNDDNSPTGGIEL